ncbi:MAG: LON peptidase substrate-binding domain-containing protein [Acidobacteria bacterium]|nr:LON peptidase substrate-binding domain-containing protein [Acidobacteriota bacterium]
MRRRLLPLFSGNVVPFPGSVLPLHAFEPLFQQMAHELPDWDEEIGVVFGRQEGFATLGCTVNITRQRKQRRQGGADLFVVGHKRFRILEVFDAAPYPRARVRFLKEVDPDPIEDAETAPWLMNLCADVYEAIHGQGKEPPFVVSYGGLAFYAADLLPLETDFRQQLLETDSETDRRRKLAKRLEAWLSRPVVE